MRIFSKDYWDQNPLVFRALLITISSIFLFVSFWNFFLSISMPTDENVFADPISKYYVTKAIKSRSFDDGKYQFDSIHKGDLIVKIDDVRIDSSSKLTKGFFYAADSSTIKLQVGCVHKAVLHDQYVKKSDIIGKVFVKLKSAVLVVSVAEGGASDRAGLKFGDIITKINGKSFSSALEADLRMRELKANSDFDYEVLRDGTLLTIKIKLAKFGISFSTFFLFLSGIFMMAVGIFFGIARPKLVAARLTAFALLFVGFSISGRINPSINMYFDSQYLFTSLMILTNAVFVFSIPIFIHSLYYFPVERNNSILLKKWTVYIPYIYSSIFLVIIMYRFLSNTVDRDFSIYSTLALVVGFIIFITIVSIKFGSKSKKVKKINRSLHYSLIFNLAVLGLVPLASSLGLNYQFLNYFNLSIMLVPLAYIYTVARYRLLDLDFRLKKNNQYLMMITILKIVMIFVLFAIFWLLGHLNLDLPNIHFTGSSIEVLSRPLRPEYVNFYNTFVSIVLSLIATFSIIFLYKKGINFFNKKYFRPKFDYKQIASHISSVIEKNYSIDNLLSEILINLKDVMLLQKAGIIIFGEGNSIFSQKYSQLKDDLFRQNIVANKALLKESTTQISGNFRIEYLPEELKQLLGSENFSLLVPIMPKGENIGLLLIGDKLSETPINNEDVLFLQSFITQAVIAIENAKLYEELAKKERMKHELELARKIQASSLPKFKPKVIGLEIAAVSIPAYEVGGDFYDYLNDGENELTVVIGDVSGKGASAALYMSKAQGILRTLAEFKLSPKELLSRTNNLLYKYIERSSFISVIASTFDMQSKEITLSRAGHLPLFMYKADEKRVVEIKPDGLILGASADDFFRKHNKEITVSFASGDIFLFATDGAVEARRGDDEFGIDRLKALIAHFRYLSAEDLIKHIIRETSIFGDENIVGDDLTLIVVKVI